MRYFGCFVSSAGGISNSINRAIKLGINSVMIHPTAPQRWFLPIKDEEINKFNKLWPNSGLQKMFFHGIYLINLASENSFIYKSSIKSLSYYLKIASKINADGVIFHVGALKESEKDKAFKKIIFAIDKIFEENQDSNTPLILETAAGAGTVIGAELGDLLEIKKGSKFGNRVKFCLDSAHLFGSGYDLKNNQQYVLNEIKKKLGFENILAIHLNDSKADLGSKKDRHEDLGKGKIGIDALKLFVNNEFVKKIPLLLETPSLKTEEGAKKEIEMLKSIMQD